MPETARSPSESEYALDLKKLTPGEWITAVAGVLLLIFGFFKWYSIDLGGGFEFSRNGWQSPGAFWSILAILIGVVLAAHVIIEKLANVDLPERLGSVGWGVFHLAGGVLAFVFILIKWVSNTDFTAFGLYAGLICAAGLAVGGFLMAKERGDLPQALGGGSGTGGGGTPPPA